LEKKGYTSHAPIYRGHGQPPEALIEATSPQWWEDVQSAYKHLQDLGYQEIAVAGLSLGGVLGLKLAYSDKVKAVITMSAPRFCDNEKHVATGFRTFSKEYEQLEGKEDTSVEEDVENLINESAPTFTQLGTFITDVQANVDMIYTPTMVVQASKDV